MFLCSGIMFLDPRNQTSIGYDCDEFGFEEKLEIDLETFHNKDNVTSFEFVIPSTCGTDSPIYLQVYDNNNPSSLTHNISLTCCEVNISSSEILSNECTALVLQLMGSEGCQYVSSYSTINGKLMVC